MKVVNCEQGSAEWHEARAGVITASMFKVARQRVGGLTEQQQLYVDAIKRGDTEAAAAEAAGYKTKPRRTETVERAIAGLPIGDFSEAAKNYAFRLAIEARDKKPLDAGFETWAMKRGHELEPMARAAHEAHAGVIVDTAGFVLSDCGTFGASADGFIRQEIGCEYKCLVAPDGIRNIVIKNDLSEFMDQIQGGMWLTGLNQWHFCLYCPPLACYGLELILHVVDRDDAYIEAMEQDLIAFHRLVESEKRALSAAASNATQGT
jgi:hypothetical protein